jgi:hypothetical protein
MLPLVYNYIKLKIFSKLFSLAILREKKKLSINANFSKLIMVRSLSLSLKITLKTAPDQTFVSNRISSNFIELSD